MATTMVPPTGTPKPLAPTRGVVTVRANLMPDAVISARQALVVRKQVLSGVGVLVALIVAFYALSWWQTGSARTDLEDMQHQNTALTNQQGQFRPVLEAQTGAGRIQTQLRSLMATDLSWNDLINRIRSAAPQGVAVTDLSGSLTGAGPGTAPVAPVAANGNAGGAVEVGTLTLTGTAHDKNAVAAFADKLAKVVGLESPLITSVASQDHAVTFGIDLVITSDALGGRYAATAPSTGGN